MNQRSISIVRGAKGHSIFEEIISLKNLFSAWKEFKKGKTSSLDIQEFEFYLEDNIFQLHEELKAKHYGHGSYAPFFVSDPKLRHIHKASVRDRLLHHAIFRILYPIFDQNFIHDSYSCRIKKGTHRAVDRLEQFITKASRNNSRLVYALKCDIRKFFDSIDHSILTQLIERKIQDEGTRWLIGKIIKSFSRSQGLGLPLGNVTSQLFGNIYLNELDQFVKHILKAKYYLRYCDDFVILGESEQYLINLVGQVSIFLKEKLNLYLHEDKITIRKHRQGVDFLGYVVLPYRRTLRTKTKRRILKRVIKSKEKLRQNLILEELFSQSIQSYLGVLKHCDGYKVKQKLLRTIEF